MFRKALSSVFALFVLAAAVAPREASASYAVNTSVMYTMYVTYQNPQTKQTFTTSHIPFYKYHWNGSSWEYKGYDDGGIMQTYRNQTSQGMKYLSYTVNFRGYGTW